MTDKLGEHLFSINPEIFSYLKRSRLFGHLPDELLEKLIPLSKKIEFPRGAEIISQGETNVHIYFLVRGEVGMYADGEWILTLRRVGDIIGEMSVISEKPSLISIVAHTPVTLFSIRSRDVGQYSDLNPQEVQNVLYRIFAMILTEKLSLTTHKAKQYESTNRKLEQAQSVLQEACEELGMQLKQMERTTVSKDFFNNILQSMLDTLIVVQPDATIQMVNPAALALLGHNEEELIGQPISTIFEKGQDLFDHHGLENLIAHGGVKNVEKTYLAKNGRSIPVMFSASVLRNDKGKCTGVVFMASDISERKRAEEERNKLEVHLRQTHKLEALGTLSGGIAHDFNNILQGMFMGIQVAEKSFPKESPVRLYLQQVQRFGRRGNELIQQILAFSRQEEPDYQPVELAPTIREALRMLNVTLPDSIELHQQIPHLSGKVHGDASQIHQIMLHLCSNAIYEMRESGGALKVSLNQVEVDQNWAMELGVRSGLYFQISVSDTGPGVDPLVRDRIFDPFFTTKPIGEGSGMGLSAIHGIVQSYEGTITIESQFGLGATFHVFLPISKRVVTLPYPEDSIGPKLQASILLVDDEKEVVSFEAKMLEHEGYRVTSFTSGTAALKQFRKDPTDFDIVLTDYRMPQMNGIQLSDALLKIRPDIPIVLMTGYSDGASPELMHNGGIRLLLLKPIDIKELSDAIQKVLAMASMMEEVSS